MPFRGGAARAGPWLALLTLIVLYFLYVFHVGAVGWLGPDEPRYSSIGFAMAAAGDWVAPRLWGEVWFEKPPLTYWLAALGKSAGLSGEWAARLPVAFLSIVFLAGFVYITRRLLSLEAAAIAGILLATSAGWVAFSQLAVTDLPLAATFCSSVLLLVWWTEGGPRWTLPVAGAFLGLAILAKGLVPVALFAPLVLMYWRRWRALPAFLGTTLLVALPWYWAVTLRYGRAFLDDFFWKHHFQRFATGALQHGQPWWFYVPILLAGLLPWTPLIAKVRPAEWWRAPHTRALLLVCGWGCAFFSASRAKLPGYVLPLLPLFCILIAVSLAEAPVLRRLLPACVLLLAFLPVTAAILPQALADGISSVGAVTLRWHYLAIVLLPAAAVYWLERGGRRLAAFTLAGLAAAAGFVWLKIEVYPVLDRTVTARVLTAQVRPHAARACADGLPRAILYGLNAYLNTSLPDCDETPRPVHVTPEGLRYFDSQ